MTSSSNFKEKNDWQCLTRTRMNTKSTEETVYIYIYHCYKSCEMFAQFDASFSDLYLLHRLYLKYIYIVLNKLLHKSMLSSQMTQEDNRGW